MDSLSRTTIRFPKSVVKTIDELASELGYSRNQAIIHLLQLALADYPLAPSKSTKLSPGSTSDDSEQPFSGA